MQAEFSELQSLVESMQEQVVFCEQVIHNWNEQKTALMIDFHKLNQAEDRVKRLREEPSATSPPLIGWEKFKIKPLGLQKSRQGGNALKVVAPPSMTDLPKTTK